jgi:hypothetical protein
MPKQTEDKPGLNLLRCLFWLPLDLYYSLKIYRGMTGPGPRVKVFLKIWRIVALLEKPNIC